MTDAPLLAIIPARGGSKGIVGKNMRAIAGRPLLAYTVDALRASGVADRIILSSDDPAARHWARVHDCEIIDRPAHLAGDSATIAQVAASVADELDWNGIVGVFQPTSPLRSPETIQRAVSRFRETAPESLATVRRESHLYWFDESEDLTNPKPLFAERVNRQYGRHGVLAETGSVQLVRSDVVRERVVMVGDDHRLLEIDAVESVDVDTYDDLAAVRRLIERRTIVFRLTGNATVGSGHLFHCLRLAEELGDLELRFLLVDSDPFVEEYLDGRGYQWIHETDMDADLERLAPGRPAVVINDVLDTDAATILLQRSRGYRVVNIEDLGPGAAHANLVVNALYPVRDGDPRHVATGHRFATLRTEFLDLPPRTTRDTPERILLTFGGTDPSGFAPRFAGLLHDRYPDIEVSVIVGPGAASHVFPDGITVRDRVASMAEEMMAADVTLTSAGRTVYEAAATGTPVVVLAQNAREATHSHISLEDGVLFAGVGALIEDDQVVNLVGRLLASAELRAELSDRLRATIDHKGAERIAHRIRGLLDGL